MYYYFVWVRSKRYHGQEALTYSSKEHLQQGAIVKVELQKELVLGIVSGLTTKPRFQTKAIAHVFSVPSLPTHLLRLTSWLQNYYPAPLGIITQQLLPVKLSDKLLENLENEKFNVPNLSLLPPLTDEQSSALHAMKSRNTYILHGSTGTGKTRIYIEMATHSIKSGKSAIVLTPEISLITQLSNSFRQVFGRRVIVMHSQQTGLERQKAWLRCLSSNEPVVIIGPRSALFSPVRKLGLIVLDEAHEVAYKQEQAPQYQAGRVAAYLATLTRASLILGTATPSVSDYYLAEQKNKPVIALTKLAPTTQYPKLEVTLVDRKDHSLFNRSSLMSQLLIDSIERSLSSREQSLLYLNRRGTARLVLCENCGWQALCPHCDIPLTYHGDQHQLRCHSCSYHQPLLTSCPLCAHPSILLKTAGTKAIVEEVKRLFPNASVARFDTDNAKADRFEQQYEAIKSGSIDIIVGTQLLAKGIDLPKLSTLGVLLADTSLYLPDFSAQERTFQLINQVLGRVGRGHIAGRAIIQTYHPDHPILLDAIQGNYQQFYERELNERHEFLFPPFCYLLKVTLRRASLKVAEFAAQNLKDTIIASHAHVRVEGPAPAFYERFQKKYQWQLVVKAVHRSELLKVIERLPANCSYDIDPLDLL
jgi:primosomal protein N' (replication factor Y) (superfamily II helicase)